MSQDEKKLQDEVQRMQKRMDRLFNDMIPSIGWVAVRQQSKWRPPTDVYETEESVIVGKEKVVSPMR
jgi:HSP20 family molecular chaperone IbpA